MVVTRNTPVMGALARLIFVLIVCLAVGHSGAEAQQVSRAITVPAMEPVSAGTPAETQLGRYYRQMEQQLLSRGHLRQDRGVSGMDAVTLARNFMAIAMRSEYSLRGGGATQTGHAAPLRRWEQPIRLGVHFGASVGAGQQQRDLATIRNVTQRLERASGHPISLVTARPNFHVLVLSDAERANARSTLQQIAPGMSRAAQNAILRMRPNTFCMVVALPARDPALGYQQAVAIVRAEHPPLMRQSCIEEELAQGMGLSNDSPDARPSIFNDDEEFGVLTRHDELLLRMLYDRNLRCGMRAGDVREYVQALARTVLASG